MANKMIKMTIRIPKHINEKLKQESKEKMISKNQIIVQACKSLLGM